MIRIVTVKGTLRVRHGFLIALFAAAMTTGPGCHSHALFTDVDMTDRNARLPDLRMIMPLTNDDRDYGKAKHAIELDITAARSKGVQQLRVGDVINFQNHHYAGPALVAQKSKMVKESMLFRLRPRGEHLYFDLLAGLGAMQIDLTLESGGVVTNGTASDLFLPIGVGLGFTAGERLDIHGRVLMNALVITTMASVMNEYEVLLTWWFTKHVAATGGYRAARYYTTDLYEQREESELDLLWSGYTAGLLWSF